MIDNGGNPIYFWDNEVSMHRIKNAHVTDFEIKS